MKFPIEVWQLILAHFDSESLKKCLIWSQDFRELVIKTPTLMKKLPVNFYGNSWKETLPFVKYNGRRVKVLKFVCCGFKEIGDIERILRNTPNVEEILCENPIFENIVTEQENNHEENNEHIEDDGSIDLEIQENAGNETCFPKVLENLKLQKLTKLEIKSNSDFAEQLLNFLKHSTDLQSFKISIITDETLISNIGEFLINQRQLENLAFHGTYNSTHLIDAIFTENFLANCKVRLKSLTAVCHLDYKEKFSRFLLNQSGNIEELTLHNYKINFHYVRLVLNHFHKLKKFSLGVSPFLNDGRAEEIKNIRMLNVRELEMTEYCEDVAVCKTLIDIFPNTEALTMDISYFSLRGILEKLPKLTKLSSDSVRIEMLVFAKSESLKELYLSNVMPIMAPFFIEKLAQDLPNIEKIVIKNIDLGKISRILDRDVKLILESLKLFKNLKFFELTNTESREISVNPDADAGGKEELVSPKFSLTIATEKGEKRLGASEYFADNHAESIEKLKIDLKIVN